MKTLIRAAAERPPCVGRSSLFFSERERDVRRAQALCRACPARQRCARDAIAREERFGVWGGMNEAEMRKAIRSARAVGGPQ
jgi:broad specificity phosphatase PhoE